MIGAPAPRTSAKQKNGMMKCFALVFLPLCFADTWKTAIGDPGLRAERPSVLVVGWSFCNEAAQPPGYSSTPSPRWADCAGALLPSDNLLGPGDPFPLPGFNATPDVNMYAVEKELFLGARCAQAFPNGVAPGETWSFHTVMLKTGNMDPTAGICPTTAGDTDTAGSRFNNLPMVQPLVSLTPAALAPVPYVNLTCAPYNHAPPKNKP